MGMLQTFKSPINLQKMKKKDFKFIRNNKRIQTEKGDVEQEKTL